MKKNLLLIGIIIINSLTLLSYCFKSDCEGCVPCRYYDYLSIIEKVGVSFYCNSFYPGNEGEYTCEGNYSLMDCYAQNVIKSLAESNKMPSDLINCSSDDDCVLSSVSGEYEGKKVEGECFKLCPVAVNKKYQNQFLKDISLLNTYLNMLCYAPEDKNCSVDEGDKNCFDPEIENTFYEKCLISGGKKCEYHNVDCPYTKAICDKDKGICVGVKE